MSSGNKVLAEEWLPVAALSIESRREAAPIPGQFPKLKTLHQWWARRPIVASAATVLAGLLPAWSAELAARHPQIAAVQSEAAYRQWFHHLIGIWGDPVQAKQISDAAKATGTKLKENPYTYRPAFKNSVGEKSIHHLHEILTAEWGTLPVVADVTAGGGSIPWASLRFALPTLANDLNSVAAAILTASLQIPAQYGTALTPLLREWGKRVIEDATNRLDEYFPKSGSETITNYLYAHAVACPRTGRLIPLMPDWWLRRGDKPAAVRMLTEIDGVELRTPRFEVLHSHEIDFDADRGLFANGRAVSPYDNLVVDGDYIKQEARAGRMTQVLYAVVVKTTGGRSFRSPSDIDLEALEKAEQFVAERLPEWERDGIVPSSAIPDASNYNRGHRMYGINRWVDFFSPRQLLTHASFVEAFRAVAKEVRSELEKDIADAVLTELALMQGKALNYNARQTSWNVNRQSTRSVFEKHNFAFKWTFVEFPGPGELLPWCLDQLVDAYDEIARLIEETGSSAPGQRMPRQVAITAGTAADIPSIADGSVHHICMDPPYYANVMYSELSNFFYAWERETLGLVRPDLFEEENTDLDNEAVTNEARFSTLGRRKKALADLDYETKMAAIFAECRRILADNGVLTVMFTNKNARAWDALGSALITAGFVVETSWPVATEPESSSHQANKNAAESTIMLVCRKRATIDDGSRRYLDDLAPAVREAARDASARFGADGIEGVDLMLSTYGPALSVISRSWPVYSSQPDENGKDRLLRPEEALDIAREEIVDLRRRRLIGESTRVDDYTDFVLMAWDIFKAREISFDAARLLALAVGGLDVEDLARAKILEKKTGTVVLLQPKQRVRRAGDRELPGVRPEATKFDYVIDAVDTALYVAEVDGMSAAKRFLDRHGYSNDGSFVAAVQGLVNAIPRTKLKGGWVFPEAGLLDTLCTLYFDGITLPVEDKPQASTPEQSALFGID
ncbi:MULTISPECIES: DUF1156 domain-containing protein [unclassified Microbispora]|uniref:DUF1156 domain-containing protein n=1 Tax=unclassified Microbispora TaxID=2614687 RepID=UPI00143A58A4|nr:MULTISPECIES: DUF1156 domain-containing protein [unclassified Microbispora]NJP26800.1 DUF1156 domain-containing protein [Microbispora sp. CL1-1]